jgi:hypothetical protein
VKTSIRFAVTIVPALLAPAALIAGCASAGAPQAAMTSRFSAMGLAFRYPGIWRSGTWNDDVSSFSGLIVFLSTGRLHDPCLRTVTAQVTSVSCGDPVSEVAPGGLLVRWDENGFPNWHAPTANTRIGGRRATETVTAGRWCQALGGSRTITAVIPLDSDNWYEMDACLRGPGIPADQAEITAMLKTVRFTAAKRAPSSRGLRRHEPGGIAHDVAGVRAQQDLNPAGDDLTRDEIHSQIAVNDEEQVDQVRVVGH